MKKLVLVSALMLTALSAPAHAHVTLSPGMASPGDYFRGALRVPHGCDGAVTTGLSVEIPEGVISVKPMLKPGWTITTETVKYAKTYKLHGKDVSEGVKRITWSGGSIPDDRFDEFVFLAKLPDDKDIMRIFLPVKQVCGNKSVEWKEIAQPDQDPHALKYPAPAIDLMPDMDHGHQH